MFTYRRPFGYRRSNTWEVLLNRTARRLGTVSCHMQYGKPVWTFLAGYGNNSGDYGTGYKSRKAAADAMYARILERQS